MEVLVLKVGHIVLEERRQESNLDVAEALVDYLVAAALF